MFKLFKKKTPVYIDLENYDYSSFARDMTEEELLTVNGGKEIANTNEAVANAKPGDTLTRSDNTTVVITEGDIKWAQEQISSPSTTSTTTTTETSSSSTTSSESNNDRPRDQNNTSGSGGSKVNLGAGTMTVSDYIAQQKKKGAGATPAGQAVEVRKNEGQAAEGNLTERGYPSSRDPNPGKYNPKKEEALPVNKNTTGTGNLSEQGYPNSRTPDVGTFYPRQKTNSENRKIKTAAQEYAENMKRKNSYTKFADWGKLETDADNMRMQDYAKYTNEDDIEEQKTIRAKDGTMNGNNHFSLVGCKMCGAAKIASEVAGHKVEMKDDINDLYDANGDGYLSREEVEEAIRAQLPEGKTVQSDWFEKTLTKEKLDEIAGWEGTTYILGMAENVYKGEPHWVVLTGYSVNDKGQVQFDYSPTSSNDLVNNRQFILGDKQSGQNNYFTISHIQTFTIL